MPSTIYNQIGLMARELAKISPIPQHEISMKLINHYIGPHSLSFQQIGDSFCVSKQRAEQISKRAITKLKKAKVSITSLTLFEGDLNENHKACKIH